MSATRAHMFENLFRNAIDHGDGDRDVTVRVESLGDGAGFYVADDGPGIAPVERDRGVRPRPLDGSERTGFGLTIVEQIGEYVVDLQYRARSSPALEQHDGVGGTTAHEVGKCVLKCSSLRGAPPRAWNGIHDESPEIGPDEDDEVNRQTARDQVLDECIHFHVGPIAQLLASHVPLSVTRGRTDTQ